MKESVHASPEQTTYANMLFYGCWLGLAIMLITYSLYVFGIITPHVPLDQMSKMWGHPVSTYLNEGGVPTGWGWFSLIASGDFINFLGIVLLAGLSIICYARLIPGLFRNGDKTMGLIAIAEVAVLLLAASGIVGSGAH